MLLHVTRRPGNFLRDGEDGERIRVSPEAGSQCHPDDQSAGLRRIHVLHQKFRPFAADADAPSSNVTPHLNIWVSARIGDHIWDVADRGVTRTRGQDAELERSG